MDFLLFFYQVTSIVFVYWGLMVSALQYVCRWLTSLLVCPLQYFLCVCVCACFHLCMCILLLLSTEHNHLLAVRAERLALGPGVLWGGVGGADIWICGCVFCVNSDYRRFFYDYNLLQTYFGFRDETQDSEGHQRSNCKFSVRTYTYVYLQSCKCDKCPWYIFIWWCKVNMKVATNFILHGWVCIAHCLLYMPQRSFCEQLYNDSIFKSWR